MTAAKPTVNPWNLSPAEVRTMDAVVKHGLNKSAATALGVSYETVADQIQSAKVKMGSANRVRQVVEWALWRAGVSNADQA